MNDGDECGGKNNMTLVFKQLDCTMTNYSLGPYHATAVREKSEKYECGVAYL